MSVLRCNGTCVQAGCIKAQITPVFSVYVSVYTANETHCDSGNMKWADIGGIYAYIIYAQQRRAQLTAERTKNSFTRINPF